MGTQTWFGQGCTCHLQAVGTILGLFGAANLEKYPWKLSKPKRSVFYTHHTYFTLTLFSLFFSFFSFSFLSLASDFWCSDRRHPAPLPTGLTTRASKPLPIFKGHYGRKGIIVKDFSWKIGPFFLQITRKFGHTHWCWIEGVLKIFKIWIFAYFCSCPLRSTFPKGIRLKSLPKWGQFLQKSLVHDSQWEQWNTHNHA